MNMPAASILDKVRKLRALATSANVHEAAAAASAAERLIQEHNLSEAELSVNEEDEAVTYDAISEHGSKIATWQSNLLWHLARAYQCCGFFRFFRVHVTVGYETTHRYVAYGRKQDLETLRYQFAFFTSEIDRLAAGGRGFGRTWLNSFRLGAVSAIGEALYETRKVTRAAASSTALVVVDRRAEVAEKKRNEDHPDLRSKKSSSRIDETAFAIGKRAGASINQKSALGSAGERLLGGRR